MRGGLMKNWSRGIIGVFGDNWGKISWTWEEGQRFLGAPATAQSHRWTRSLPKMRKIRFLYFLVFVLLYNKSIFYPLSIHPNHLDTQSCAFSSVETNIPICHSLVCWKCTFYKYSEYSEMFQSSPTLEDAPFVESCTLYWMSEQNALDF